MIVMHSAVCQVAPRCALKLNTQLAVISPLHNKNESNIYSRYDYCSTVNLTHPTDALRMVHKALMLILMFWFVGSDAGGAAHQSAAGQSRPAPEERGADAVTERSASSSVRLL